MPATGLVKLASTFDGSLHHPVGWPAGIRYAPARGDSTLALLKLALILVSALSFLGYGSACFLSTYIKREFDRYRLGSQSALVGALQLGAALGLVVGLDQPWIGRAASGGLALMMLIAVGVRIRIKDTLLQTTPALLFLALNTYLCWAAF